jgi:methyl-accepting chemotaxis protein
VSNAESARAAGQAAQAAGNLSQQAEDLKRLMTQFKV